MPRIFKVPCFDKPPQTISGDLIAQAVGSYYSLQIIGSEGCEYRAVSVLAYEDDSLEFTSGFDSIRDLCEWLHNFSTFDSDVEPTNIVAATVLQKGAQSWGLDPVTLNQDVMEVAGDVLDMVRRHISGLESLAGD